MSTFYLICFVLGFVLSLMAVFSGLGRLHIGHLHLGHLHLGSGHARTPAARPSSATSAINGFTLPAFLCWFGGAGYLLLLSGRLHGAVVLLVAVLSGLVGAGAIYLLLFKFLLPRERVLRPEDTQIDGTIARVSAEIRGDGAIGEIIFSQLGARRSYGARSESGQAIARGTEVLVLRSERGVASVRPLDEFNH